MEIEAGEYVRINHMYNEQKIAKIVKILDKDPCYKNMQMYQIDVIHQKGNGHFRSFKIYEEDIVKHSKDVIDLIEEGDYVNGEYVAVIEKNKEGNITDICYEEENEGQLYSIGDIKSIVTKEMFSQIEYKVKE